MKHVNHPTKGLLGFDSEMLHDPESDHWVMLFTPSAPPASAPAALTAALAT